MKRSSKVAESLGTAVVKVATEESIVATKAGAAPLESLAVDSSEAVVVNAGSGGKCLTTYGNRAMWCC